MTVISSIVESTVKPSNKSYWECRLLVGLESVDQIRNKKHLYPTEKRAMMHEFSQKEPIKDFVILDNSSKSSGRLTTFQIKEMFNDMGFNVDPTFSGKHHADFEAVMNVGGYSIPGWVRVARFISYFLPSYEKVLLRKLSPGRDRLHLRFFESNDGTWLIAGHTDYNWLSLNLPRVFKAHVKISKGVGSGDYVTGTIMLYLLLKEFSRKVEAKQKFLEKDIQRILNQAYKQSVVKKFKFQ